MSMSPCPLNDQVRKPNMLTLQRLAKSYKKKELQNILYILPWKIEVLDMCNV